MSSNVPATRDDVITVGEPQQIAGAIMDLVVGTGDLGGLQPRQRVEMYLALCDSVGLNPLSRPFEYIKLNGKLTLYFKATGAEQLRVIHGVNVAIASREMLDDMYVVTATAVLPSGRSDESQGIVCMDGLKRKDRANAMMKCETKAKRRVTMSLLGMSFLEDVYAKPQNADKGIVVHVDGETGEITNQASIAAKEERDEARPDDMVKKRRSIMSITNTEAPPPPANPPAPAPKPANGKNWPKFIADAADHYGMTTGTIEAQLGDTARFVSYAEAKEVLEAFINKALADEDTQRQANERKMEEEAMAQDDALAAAQPEYAADPLL